MPLTWGGGIRSLSEIEEILMSGADKVSLNTMIMEDTNSIKEAIKRFGSQAIVASADVKKIDNNYIVFSNNGKKNTKLNAA